MLDLPGPFPLTLSVALAASDSHTGFQLNSTDFYPVFTIFIRLETKKILSHILCIYLRLWVFKKNASVNFSQGTHRPLRYVALLPVVQMRVEFVRQSRHSISHSTQQVSYSIGLILRTSHFLSPKQQD